MASCRLAENRTLQGQRQRVSLLTAQQAGKLHISISSPCRTQKWRRKGSSYMLYAWQLHISEEPWGLENTKSFKEQMWSTFTLMKTSSLLYWLANTSFLCPGWRLFIFQGYFLEILKENSKQKLSIWLFTRHAEMWEIHVKLSHDCLYTEIMCIFL